MQQGTIIEAHDTEQAAETATAATATTALTWHGIWLLLLVKLSHQPMAQVKHSRTTVALQTQQQQHQQPIKPLVICSSDPRQVPAALQLKVSSCQSLVKVFAV
jgi:hypothetical protein